MHTLPTHGPGRYGTHRVVDRRAPETLAAGYGTFDDVRRAAPGALALEGGVGEPPRRGLFVLAVLTILGGRGGAGPPRPEPR